MEAVISVRLPGRENATDQLFKAKRVWEKGKKKRERRDEGWRERWLKSKCSRVGITS